MFLAQIQAAIKIGAGNENVVFTVRCIILCDMCFCLRPLAPSWTRIRVQPCLRSLIWVLNKEDCGSAGCPPMGARTPASSTSPLKVCVCAFFWVRFPAHNSNKGNFFFLSVSTQSPLCPLLPPDCWKKEASSCWWCRWTPTEETAPLSQPGSSTSRWRT